MLRFATTSLQVYDKEEQRQITEYQSCYYQLQLIRQITIPLWTTVLRILRVFVNWFDFWFSALFSVISKRLEWGGFATFRYMLLDDQAHGQLYQRQAHGITTVYKTLSMVNKFHIFHDYRAKCARFPLLSKEKIVIFYTRIRTDGYPYLAHSAS